MTSPAAPAAIVVVPYSTFNSLRLGRNINKNGEFMGITILLLDELRAYLLRRGDTRHDASSFTALETLMNHKANIRALFQSNGWILSQTAVKPEEEEKWSAAFWKMVTWSLQDEDGTRDEEDEEKCYLEYPNVEDVDNV
uniref:Uncharacterized protein n=1 Tax=Brassica oleracea var. oleracea TaxID=109376 RepID=A0A0D3BQG9_BRAOL